MTLPNTWVTGQTFTAADADNVANAVNANTVAVAAAYTKPGPGIPKTDLAAAVQTSLGLADTALQSGAAVLTATAVKTSAYTAAPGDLIPADATSAAFTVTLPTAPADKSRIVIKKIDASTNAVTVACGGADVFNASGGSTGLTLTLQFQAVQLQYKASGGIWYVISTDVPLGGLDARYADVDPSGNGPFNGVLAHLTHNRSAVLQATGDSTVANANSWFALLGDRLGSYFDANVWMCTFNDTNQAYDPPTVRRTSTQGARTVTGSASYPAPTILGDTEIIAQVTATTWALNEQILTKYNVTGNQRGIYFSKTATGALKLQWSANGSADAASATSTANVAFTNGQPGWVRVTLDVDNGSSGWSVKFYTSTTGVTWTQLGSTVTGAGVTSVFNTTAPYVLGAGAYAWAQVRNALANGIDQVPNMPDQWNSNSGVVIAGGPVVMLMNGAVAGKDLVYNDDSTRRPKIFSTPLPDVIMVGEGHNDTSLYQKAFADKYLTYVRHIKFAQPGVPLVTTTQNPIAIGTNYSNAWELQQFAARIAAMTAVMAAESSVTVLDTFAAFTDVTTQVSSDGLHPTAAGYQAQADWMMRRLAPKTML